jgi:hypothetical protein
MAFDLVQNLFSGDKQNSWSDAPGDSSADAGFDYNPNLPQYRIAPFENPPPSRWASPHYKGVNSGVNLFRGWMIEEPLLPGGVGFLPINQRYKLNFLFNPQAISMAYDIDPAGTTLPENLPADAGATTNRLRGISVSFQLIFDRVGQIAKVPDGVNADVRILSKIITGGRGGPGRNTNTGLWAPVRCVFGRTPDPGTFRPRGSTTAWRPNPLGFTGFLIAATVDYTRFSTDMTPTRAVFNISLRADYYAPNADPAGQSNATAFPTTRATKIYPTGNGGVF